MHFHITNPWEDPTSNSRLELVFDHRFKDYGAYDIRRHYARNKLIAMFLAGSMAMGFAMLFVSSSSNTKPFHTRVVPELPPVNPPDLNYPFGESPGGGGSGSNGPANNSQVPEPDLAAPSFFSQGFPNASPGNGPGDSNEDIYGLGPANGLPGDGEGPAAGGKGKPVLRNSGCSYYGGDKKFIEYVQDNFKTPQQCLEAAAQGFALVKFRVDEKGKIAEVQVLESSEDCPGFRAETIRVLMVSPRWIAAVVNGRYVSSWREMRIVLQY